MGDSVNDISLTRSEQAYQLYLANTNIESIAQTLGITSRSVYRDVKKEKLKAKARKTKTPDLTDKLVTDKSPRNTKKNDPHFSHLSSAQNTPGQDGASLPGTPIPEEIQRIALYMKYFDQKGLSVKFNEILSYLDKTQQLDSGSGSELAQQMSTQQLLAVIKPSESLQPANSVSMSSCADLISPTNRLINNS